VETTQVFNLNLLYKKIKEFYQSIIGIEFEDEFFVAKDSSVENFRKLAELITGISAQCDKRGYFLNVMQNMDHEDSTELFTILTERISAYTEDMKIEEFRKNEESEEDEQTALYLRIESLELENAKLHDEVSNLNTKVAELTKENYTFELTVKEVEGKYQELLNTLEHRNSDMFKQNDLEDTVNLSIQLSELRGKLEAKEKNIHKLREEKEKLIDDYKGRLLELQRENETLREKSIKYDVLKEKMHSLDDVNNLKAKLIQSERIIKDQEDKIKKLKNFDQDKNILLKKIEELHFELSQEKEKINDYIKENNYYKDLIVQHEQEIKFLKKQIENKSTEYNSENPSEQGTKTISLSDLEEDANHKRYVLELETKVKFFQSDKDGFYKEKSELEQNIITLNAKIEENQKELEKFTKKEAKYSKYKEEKHTFITKISDLMEKVHELKAENESLKYSTGKEKTELESNFNNNVNTLMQKHNEEIFNMKEIVNRIENENNYLKKEIKKTEDLNDSNKLYIEELHRKIQNPNSDTKLMEIESKLKEFATNENLELKRKISEKEESITKLTEKIKIYDTKMKEYAGEIEKLKKISEEVSIEELKKRDEAINYYKQQLEMKEKLFNDEQQMVSSLFHQLALEYSMLQVNHSEGPLNFNINKL
jgi:chromosome segregation ATPase